MVINILQLRNMKKLKLALILVASITLSVKAQSPSVKASFGKGIRMTAADSSFTMNIGFRFQTLFAAEALADNLDEVSTRMMIRRSRIKLDGFAYSPKLEYKVELALSNNDISGVLKETGNSPNIVLDAVLKWKPVKNLEVWFGQTKLPGNRERVISSQAMQFVDRSQLNSEYNIDRDLGIQIHHSFSLGTMIIRDIYSVSLGEGRNIVKDNTEGFDYTGRIEVLPFGKFENKGDYFGSDLEREETPKLSLAATYDYNDDAEREKGQLGKFIYGARDLSTIFADMMFKYQGFSIMAEYANKQTTDPIVKDDDGEEKGKYIVGTGLNIQSGYLFKNNIELAARYTEVKFEKEIDENPAYFYTLGLSKYFVGHNLKIQTDITLTDEEFNDETPLLYRFQVELAF